VGGRECVQRVKEERGVLRGRMGKEERKGRWEKEWEYYAEGEGKEEKDLEG
jgi:hypothetical protein